MCYWESLLKGGMVHYIWLWSGDFAENDLFYRLNIKNALGWANILGEKFHTNEDNTFGLICRTTDVQV